MLDSGLRFAFAFLPAGVAIVVGLVLAVQRRRVQPAVATPAIAGLALQLVAALLSASTVVVLPALLGSGSSTSTVLTASSLIGVVTALLTVLGWVLLLIALFRRLPASAPTAMSAPTPAAGLPVPAPPFGQPPADDAPTGRHALLDEHGQQVIAQEGVRLSPRTAALAGGAAVGAAGTAGAVAAHEGDGADGPSPAGRAEELPTEAVPVLGHTPAPAETGAPDAESGRAGEDDASDAGPAGVDESAVGGMPTETRTGDEDADGQAGPAGQAFPDMQAGPAGPAGVDESAVGGMPTETRTGDEDADGQAGPGGQAGPDGQAGPAGQAGPGYPPAIRDGVHPPGSAVGSTSEPGAAHDEADDATTETFRSHRPRSSDGPATPGETPEPETADAGEASGETPTAATERPPDPSPVSVDEAAVGGVPTDATAGSAARDGEPPADRSADGERPGRPEPAETPEAAAGPSDADHSGPTKSGASAATVAATSATPATPPSGPPSQPGREAGDLFRPVTPEASAPDEAAGGTPTGAPRASEASEASEADESDDEADESDDEADESDDEEHPGLVERTTSRVAGWFEPVTNSQEGGFSRPAPPREGPPSNGYHQGR